MAETWCARCHVIGLESLTGGSESTPSFFLIHDKLHAYRERAGAFDERRPHRAMTFDVDQDDREDLIAYVRLLQRP